MGTLSVIKTKLSGRFARNTGWLIADRLLHMAISLVVSALVSRYLTKEEFGLIEYGTAFVQIFATICKLGLDAVLVNELLKNRNKTGDLLGSTLVLRLVSGFLSCFIVFGCVLFLNPGEPMTQLIVTLQAVSLLFMSCETISYWFQAYLRSKYTVIAKTIAYLLVSGWRLAMIALRAPVLYFAIATVLEEALIGICLLIFYRADKGRQKLSFSMQSVQTLLSQSHHFILASLLVVIYTQIDKIMIQQLSDNVQLAMYGAASKIANLWVFIPTALIESARPLIMQAKGEDERLYVKRYKQLYCAIIWIGIAVAVLFSLFAPIIVYILNGTQYVALSGTFTVPLVGWTVGIPQFAAEGLYTPIVLILLIWSRIFSVIGTARNIWLVTEGANKYAKYLVAVGAVVNVVFNLLLIGSAAWWGGAVGAAIATVLAEMLSSVLAPLMFRKTRPFSKLVLESFLFIGVRDKTPR